MPRDTCDEIVAATGRVLSTAGYADLTTRRIADEAGVSTAALHYHYGSKADLVAAYLDDRLDRFEARLDEVAGESDPARRLCALLDEPMPAPEDDDGFRTAMLELEAQAPYDDAVRERLAGFDAAFRDHIREALVAGVDAGAVTLDRAAADEAAFLATVVHGAGTRAVAFGAAPRNARRFLREYLARDLLVDADPGALDALRATEEGSRADADVGAGGAAGADGDEDASASADGDGDDDDRAVTAE